MRLLRSWSHRRATLFLALVTINLVAWGAFAVQQADAGTAGSSFGNATCVSSPAMCLDGYVQSNYVHLRVYEYYGSPSTIQTQSASTLPYARNSWTALHGPQIVQYGPSATATPYINLYLEEYPAYQPTDQYNLAALSGAAAIEVNMAYNGSSWYYCYTNPCRVGFAQIFVNANKFSACPGGWSAGTMQYVQAHEIGHTLGLDDVGSGNILMNNSWSTWCGPNNGGVNGPTSSEEGNYPACSATPKGVRCIYNWPY